MRITGFFAGVVLAVSATLAQSQTQEEMAFAHSVLNALQARSIAEGREYCGYLARNRAGELVATPAVRGDEASCEPDYPDDGLVVFADYHTHGAYHPDYENELPSLTDVEGNMELEIDGYISTPGGRLWFVDGSRGVSSQICPDTCVLIDPNGRDEGNVPRKVTLRQLRAWE